MSYYIWHDTTLSEWAPGVLGNDWDADALTAELATGASNGVLTFNADGSFDYTPDPGFVGQDSFTYTATDGITESDPATVTITVDNDTPFADDDWYYMVSDSSLIEWAPGVLGNDWDADPLTAELETGASNGVLTFNADGSFDYTPDPGFVGQDSFTYTATDGEFESSPATVTIDVQSAMPLTLNLPAQEPPVDVTGITVDEVRVLAHEAFRRWALIGVDADTLRQAVSGLEFHVQDLPGSKLAVAAPGHIAVDVNAAGYGWYVDPSPRDDTEFQTIVSGTELQATANSAAAGRVDLLTVLTHEFGHLLHLPDLPTAIFPHHIMSETIGLGTRRVTDQIPLRDDPYVPQANHRDNFFQHLATGIDNADPGSLDESLLNWARDEEDREPGREQSWTTLILDLARSIVQRDHLAQGA